MYTCTFMQVAACVQKKPESRSLDSEATVGKHCGAHAEYREFT